MKKNSYIILALAGMLSMNSCNDDEFLPGNPSMEMTILVKSLFLIMLIFLMERQL